jgi:hypothetical protein
MKKRNEGGRYQAQIVSPVVQVGNNRKRITEKNVMNVKEEPEETS